MGYYSWIYMLVLVAAVSFAEKEKKCKKPTVGGNDEGKCCVFPFTYNKKTYNSCTRKGSTKLWCATTKNFDIDGRWGYSPICNRGLCPISHPHVYWSGEYCCKYDKENGFEGSPLDLCSGKKLRFNSQCCQDDEYVKCPSNDDCQSRVSYNWRKGIYFVGNPKNNHVVEVKGIKNKEECLEHCLVERKENDQINGVNFIMRSTPGCQCTIGGYQDVSLGSHISSIRFI